MKYYIIGVLSSALMLYGMSLIFGFAGSTKLSEISEFVSTEGTKPLLTIAIFLTLVGFAFKVERGAVPLLGARTPTRARRLRSPRSSPSRRRPAVSSPCSTSSSSASTAPDGAGADLWWPLVWVLAAASMTLGNLGALRQTNIVRMLAYSSIAQGGFMLVPFAAAGIAAAHGDLSVADNAFGAVIVYLLVYGAMNLGAFAVVIAVARRTRSAEISSYDGLFQTSPGLAVMMTIFLASLAGVPPLAGWFAKFVMFSSALAGRQRVGDGARDHRGRQLGDRVLLLRERDPRDVVPRARDRETAR